MYTIHIPVRHQSVTVGQYVQMIRTVKAAAPGTQYKTTLTTWWPGTREDVLRQFGQLVTDKINRHLVIAGELKHSRLLAKMRAKLKSECRWCGTSLGRYETKERRFCDHSCRRDYYGV